MIEFLVAEYGLDKVGAYMLCSVAGDLRMHEVVGDAGNYLSLKFTFYSQVDMPNYVVRGIMSAF